MICPKGTYFTSSFNYARSYAKASKQGVRPILLAMTEPGNQFPVVERAGGKGSLLGKPCQKGYQSHYALVAQNLAPDMTGHVAPLNTPKQNLADEMVLFESAQAVPKYVIFTK